PTIRSTAPAERGSGESAFAPRKHAESALPTAFAERKPTLLASERDFSGGRSSGKVEGIWVGEGASRAGGERETASGCGIAARYHLHSPFRVRLPLRSLTPHPRRGGDVHETPDARPGRPVDADGVCAGAVPARRPGARGDEPGVVPGDVGGAEQRERQRHQTA